MASGLYEPAKGGVTVDDVDIRQLDPNYLRSQVALLGQNERLFLGTLRENLDLARTDNLAGDRDLLVALHRFGMLNFVQRHPKGLDLPLGENGMGLSGGQKQLVALARMTIKDPRIVLLDEPTSHLDQESEEMVLSALAQWLGNRTLMVVTHRPQVLSLVNRVIVMENGEVIMDGPRDAVLNKLNEIEREKRMAHRKSVEETVTAGSGAKSKSTATATAKAVVPPTVTKTVVGRPQVATAQATVPSRDATASATVTVQKNTSGASNQNATSTVTVTKPAVAATQEKSENAGDKQ